MTRETDPDRLLTLVREYVEEASRFMSRGEAFIHKRALEKLDEENVRSGLATRLESRLLSLSGARVLEIGSGSGGLSVALAIRGASVAAVEPSWSGLRASVERAKRYPSRDVTFLAGVAEHLPFGAESFDLVVSCEVIEHVRDPQRAVDEMWRVLRPGGLVYCEIPNAVFPREDHYRILWPPFAPKRIARAYARLRGKDPRLLEELNFITPRRTVTLFARAGFRQLENVYAVELAGRMREPDRLRSRFARGLLRATRLMGIGNLAARVWIGSGLYPAIQLFATKPSEVDRGGGDAS